MTIVKELNGLAEKMTGTNPKKTTDAMAVKYISDNYSSGNEPIEIQINDTFTDEDLESGAVITLDDEMTEKLDKILSDSKNNKFDEVVIKLDTTLYNMDYKIMLKVTNITSYYETNNERTRLELYATNRTAYIYELYFTYIVTDDGEKSFGFEAYPIYEG